MAHVQVHGNLRRLAQSSAHCGGRGTDRTKNTRQTLSLFQWGTKGSHAVSTASQLFLQSFFRPCIAWPMPSLRTAGSFLVLSGWVSFYFGAGSSLTCPSSLSPFCVWPLSLWFIHVWSQHTSPALLLYVLLPLLLSWICLITGVSGTIYSNITI